MSKEILSNHNLSSHIKDHILFEYDQLWALHIEYATEKKEAIHFVRLGGQTPLRVFHEQTDEHFEFIQDKIKVYIDNIC